MRSEFTQPVPEIPVTDIDKAADYYVNNLGFTLDWNADDIGLAGISRGNCRMFLANQAFREGHGNAAPVLIWLNLDSKEEVDELYREWLDSGAIRSPRPNQNPGACTNSRQRTRTATCSVFSMTSERAIATDRFWVNS